MPYEYGASQSAPFIPSDGTVRSLKLGEITLRCIDGGGPALAAAVTAARSSASQESRRSLARSRGEREETLDERLERLGVGVNRRRRGGMAIVDIPL
jgi:hypothetical protein